MSAAMTRREAILAISAGALGLLSGQAVFSRPAKAGELLDETRPDTNMATFLEIARWVPTDIAWDIGQYKTITLTHGARKVVLQTSEIMDALEGK